MSNAALSLSPEETAAWNASDALIDKQEAEAAKIWAQLSARGLEAVRELMEYLSKIEGQNYRLNKRIEHLEASIRLLDRLDRVLEREKIK